MSKISENHHDTLRQWEKKHKVILMPLNFLMLPPNVYIWGNLWGLVKLVKNGAYSKL